MAPLATIFASFGPACAVAGPPYVTDDPDPTEYRHWEIYTGFQYENDAEGSAWAAIPFAEFNYGLLPNVQVSISSQLESNETEDVRRYGYGGTDFGIKTRFVQESDRSPQISFYPSIALPGVAGGHIVTFLPVWVQKSAGRWTGFGGGGLYLNRGPGMRDYTFVGGAVENAISPGITIGGELFHQSPATIGGTDSTGANLGFIGQVGEFHAVLFSFGRALHGRDEFSAYTSYEFELGPQTER